MIKGNLFFHIKLGLTNHMTTRLSPDEICAAFADAPKRLTVRHLESDTVLIEGNAEALEFLGNLLIAQARVAKDCGFQLSPAGAGSTLFSSEATIGLYIHRLPCLEHNPGE